MKILKLAVLLLAIGMFFVQCAENETNDITTDGLPQKFTVDIPTGISNNASLKSATGDDFSGAEIYEHLRNFIALGEEAASIIEEIMIGISSYGLNKPMDFTFDGDDGRLKHLVVLDDVTFEGANFAHQLSMSDVDSEGNDDNGLAMQVFWNNNPIGGVAILKPYNWDRTSDSEIPNTMFRIDYTEAGTLSYDATMGVSISGWEYDQGFDRFNMDNLKMFVGKKGDVVNVYGNSNHPDAWLYFDDTVGISWAFVASGSDSEDIAVAEVGLPWSFIDSDSRDVILGNYSLKNVFVREVSQFIKDEYGFEPTPQLLEPYLAETNAPAFFNLGGFVSGGEMPNNSYQVFVDHIATLVPFNPKSIAELELAFKN